MRLLWRGPERGTRFVGVRWHRAEHQWDTVNRLSAGFWVGALEFAWWPAWAGVLE